MKSLLIAFPLAFVGTCHFLSAQQSTSTAAQLPVAQTTSTLCVSGTASAPLAAIKIKPRSRWQQMVDKQLADIANKTGVVLPPVDISKLPGKVQSPSPCPVPGKAVAPTPAQIPATAPTGGQAVAAKVRTKIACFPLFYVPDSYLSAIPKKADAFEADDVVVDSTEGNTNTATVPCFAIRIDPRSRKYWVTDPILAE